MACLSNLSFCLFVFLLSVLTVHEASQTEPAGLDAPHHGSVRLPVSPRGSAAPAERTAEMKGSSSPSSSPPPPSSPLSPRGQGTRL